MHKRTLTGLLEILQAADSAAILPKASDYIDFEPDVIKGILFTTITSASLSGGFESVELILRPMAGCRAWREYPRSSRSNALDPHI